MKQTTFLKIPKDKIFEKPYDLEIKFVMGQKLNETNVKFYSAAVELPVPATAKYVDQPASGKREDQASICGKQGNLLKSQWSGP